MSAFNYLTSVKGVCLGLMKTQFSTSQENSFVTVLTCLGYVSMSFGSPFKVRRLHESSFRVLVVMLQSKQGILR